MIPYSSRLITVNPEPESSRKSRVRVNVVYERDLRNHQIRPLRKGSTPPPILQLEGYLNEPPAWAGVEVEVKQEPRALQMTTENYCPPSYSYTTNDSSMDVVDNDDSYIMDMPVYDVATEGKPLVQKETFYEGTSGYTFYEDQEEIVDIRDDDIRKDNTRPRSLPTQSSCNLCGIYVTTTQRRQHIYTCHLKKAMYRCPFCTYTSAYHRGNVAQHIRRKHHSARPPECLKDEHSYEIEQWMYRCFNDNRIFRCVDQDVVSVVQNLLDWVVEGRTEVPLLETSDNFVDPLIRNSCGTPNVGEVNHRLRPSSRCNACGMGNIKHLERHVLQYHVRCPMYFCPFCNYSSNYSASSVKEHIKARHSLTEKAEPVDARDEHWHEIRAAYEQCFVDEEDKKRMEVNSMKSMFY